MKGIPVEELDEEGLKKLGGCLESVEVGTYDTCLAGCKYCYSNDSVEAVKRKSALYDAHNPLLCGKVEEGDRITLRKGRLVRE